MTLQGTGDIMHYLPKHNALRFYPRSNQQFNPLIMTTVLLSGKNTTQVF